MKVQGLVAESLVSPEKCYTGMTVFFVAGKLGSSPSNPPPASLRAASSIPGL